MIKYAAITRKMKTSETKAIHSLVLTAPLIR